MASPLHGINYPSLGEGGEDLSASLETLSIETPQSVEELSALHTAILGGDEDLAISLIKNGASIDELIKQEYLISRYPLIKQTFFCNATFLAIGNNRTRLMRYLLEEKKIDLNASVDNIYPLHFAALVDEVEIGKLLLDHQAGHTKINKDKETPFDIALRFKRKQFLLMLIQERGINIDALDSNGQSYLHKAVLKKSIAEVRLLLSLKANPNANNKEGLSSIALVGQMSFNDKTESIMDLLIRKGGRRVSDMHPMYDDMFDKLGVLFVPE